VVDWELEVGEMKKQMQISDRAKLECEGCWYNPSSQYGKSKAAHLPVNNKGRYFKNQFIGSNYKEALNWLHRHGV